MPHTVQSASQPANLESPIPGQQEQAAVIPVPAAITDELLLQQFQQRQVAPVPEPTPVPTPPAEVSDEELLAKFQQRQVAAPVPEEAGFFERATFSFTRTDFERRGLLEKTFGAENVKEEDGEFSFRRSKDQAFRKFDSDDFEILNDIVADNFREIFEGATEAGILGTAVGIAGGTAGFGILPAIAVGAGAGVVATNLGDVVAEDLGIERDPERSRVFESSVAAAAGGLFSFLGGAVARALTRKQAAKLAAEKATGLQSLPQQSKNFVEAVDDLKGAGLDVTVTGSDGKPLSMLLTNLDPQDPATKKVINQIRDNPDFVRIQGELGEVALDNVDNIIQSMGKTGGLRKAKDIAGRDENIAEKVVGFVKKLDADEGKAIGNFKAFAREQLKEPSPAVRTAAVRDDIFQKIGLDVAADDVSALTSANIADALIVDESAVTKTLAKELLDLHGKLRTQNGLTVADTDKFIKRIGQLNDKSAVKKDKDLRRAVGQLSSALRADRRDIVESALPDVKKGEFRTAMDKFVQIRQSTSQVSELLDGDNMARGAFVQAIFNKGKGGLADLRAARAVIEAENPALWKELTGEFLDKIIRDVTKDGTEALTIKGFASKLNSFGPDIKKELLESAPYTVKNLNDALLVARQIEKTKLASASETITDEVIGSGISILSPFRQARVNGFKNIFKIVFNEDAQKVLTQQGVDKFLTGVPKAERKQLKTKILDSLILLGKGATRPARLATEAGIRGGLTEAQAEVSRALGE